MNFLFILLCGIFCIAIAVFILAFLCGAIELLAGDALRATLKGEKHE